VGGGLARDNKASGPRGGKNDPLYPKKLCFAPGDVRRECRPKGDIREVGFVWKKGSASKLLEGGWCRPDGGYRVEVLCTKVSSGGGIWEVADLWEGEFQSAGGGSFA